MSFSGCEMLRPLAAIVPLLLPVTCAAATDLGVPWPSLTVELNVAASRMGVGNLASNGTCDQGRRDPCRWTTPDGIDFSAESDGSGHLQRIEADWSGDDHPKSAAAYRAACAAVVSLVLPRWSKAQVDAAVARTMVITDVRGTAPERQQTAGGLHLFGDRNARSEPTRPGAAFLQCGASPDY